MVLIWRIGLGKRRKAKEIIDLTISLELETLLLCSGGEQLDYECLHANEAKNQMPRTGPTFGEKAPGYASFGDVTKYRHNIAEFDDPTGVRKVRLGPEYVGESTS